MAKTSNLGLTQPAMSDRVADTIPALASNFAIIDALMPVGYVLTTTQASFNPSRQYPGTTWTQLHDVFLVASGSQFSGGSTGGAKSHHHVIPFGFDHWKVFLECKGSAKEEHLPKYGDEYRINFMTAFDHAEVVSGEYRVAYTETIDHLPPYKAVYMWERTS